MGTNTPFSPFLYKKREVLKKGIDKRFGLCYTLCKR